MKIATLLGSLSRNNGGVSEVARRLAQELAAPGDWQMEVLGLRDEFWEDDRAGWAPLLPRALDPAGPRSFGYAPFSRALDAFQPELLHVHGLWMYPSLAARRWAQRRRAPCVISAHGMLDRWALANSRWKKRVASVLFERRNLERAACLHAITSAEREAMRAFGLRAPICVIPNAVDLPRAGAAYDAPPWTPEPERQVLLYLGRLHPKKGLLPLIEGWHLASEAEPRFGREWRLVIAGWDQSHFSDLLQRRVAELGLEHEIHFPGPQFGRAKDAAYHHAAAFVLPSFSEGLPLVVLEAWAHRLPVLMTPECALPIGFAREAALRIEPHPASIRDGLLQLARLTQDERQLLGENGHRLVAADYTWPAVAADMRRVYEWLLQRAPRPTSIQE